MQTSLNTLRLEVRRERTWRGKHSSVKWHERLLLDEALFNEGFAIDYEQLVKSADADGEFYILTCGCGEPACSGLSHGIEVHHAGGAVRWHVRQPGPERDYTFSGKQYRLAIFEGLTAARKLITGTGDVPIGPLGFSRNRFDACVKGAEAACLG